MPLASFAVSCSAGQPATIEVNGKPLPAGMAVQGLTLRNDGPAPVLTLLVAGEGVLEGEGIVEVVRESQEDYRAELRAIIEKLDPDELDRKALEHAPTLNSKPGEGYKAALLELIG